MQVDKELIQKVAKNARLQLSEQEIKEFLPEIKEILEAFSKLQQAPSSNLNPSFQPIEVKNITREDKIEPCLIQDQALQNTNHKKEGYFKGPKVF